MLWLTHLLSVIFSGIILSLLILLRKRKGKGKTNVFWSPINWHTKHRKMKIFIAAILLGGTLIVTFNISTRLAYLIPAQPIHGHSEWRDSNGQPYLYVEATDRYSLGYLQGQGLAKQIVNFRSVVQLLGLLSNIPYTAIINQAQNYLTHIPSEYLEEMRGMADGASQGSGWVVSFNDILVQNCFLDMAYGHWIPQGLLKWGYGGCTDVGAKNADGSIFLGQNLDYPKIMDLDGPYPSMSFVHMKYRGVPESFGCRMGGMLSLPTIKTAANFTVLVTIIESNVAAEYSMPAVIVARNGFEKASTLDELIQFVFVDHKITASFSVLASDGQIIGGIQCTPLGYRISYDSAQVYTNRFFYDDWNDAYFTDGDYSLARQRYTERLLWEKLVDGYFSYDDLLAILSTTENGWEGENSAPCYDQGVFGDASLATFTGTHFSLGREFNKMGVVPL